jgi:two-component system cell cycle response regulator
MHPKTSLTGTVPLIAEDDSALAAQVAAELARNGFSITRIQAGDPTDGESTAMVLVEHESAVDALGLTVARLSVPALVLAATHELMAGVLQVLDPRHDVALVSEGSHVIAWRLSRLLDSSRRMAQVMSHFDPLTGLPNRRAFEAALHRVAESTDADATVGLLMLDLDRFKEINDSAGHVAGDAVLRAVGELLRRTLAPGDLVARLGGDEFGVILTGKDPDAVTRDGERLLAAIAGLDVPTAVDHKAPFRLTASAGLTFVRRDAKLQELMSEADVAAYEAKNDGRNRLVLYRSPAEAASRSNADLRLRHFESSTRLASERLVEMIALRSRRLVETAKWEANTCPLTGLHNRRHFDAELSVEIDRARRHGRPLSLAFVDLDHFHDVNMTHGWPTGDRVLQAFASVARSTVRARDSVARFGGEEFVILMPDTTLDSAREVTERVRAEFEASVVEGVEGQRVTATFSAGVAQLREDTDSPIQFVNRASHALLRAKHAGRNRVEAAATESDASLRGAGMSESGSR